MVSRPPLAIIEGFRLVVGLDDDRVQRGEEHAEGGAHADFARDLDPALVLFHDAVNGGQSQAGAAADFLRGKERLEDARQHFRVHAAAGVLDRRARQTPHARLGPVSHVISVESPPRWW